MKRRIIAASIFAALFSTCWIGGVVVAPGPIQWMYVVVGLVAPAALAFGALLIIEAAIDPDDREREHAGRQQAKQKELTK